MNLASISQASRVSLNLYMLLILPIILSRIPHIFHPLFFIYSHAITYYSIIIPEIWLWQNLCLIILNNLLYAGIIGSGLIKNGLNFKVVFL